MYVVYYLLSMLFIYFAYAYNPWFCLLAPLFIYMGIDDQKRAKIASQTMKMFNNDVIDVVDSYDLSEEDEKKIMTLINQAMFRIKHGQDSLESTKRLKKEVKEFLKTKDRMYN